MKSKIITQTLKEVSENKYIQGVHIINGIDICEASRECFIEGAKFQQEYLLSLDEEELFKTDNDRLLYQAGVLKGMLRKIELQNKEISYNEEIEKLWSEYRIYTNNEDAWCFKQWLVEKLEKK